jgi:hypothetical protein
MGSRVAFSGQHLPVAEIAKHHQDVESSLKLYFSHDSSQYSIRFASYTESEVKDELKLRLSENDLSLDIQVF